MSIKIKRGSDKKFTIKLRYANGDPYPLTDLTKVIVQFTKFDNRILEIDNSTIVATKASKVHNEVTYTANTAGITGNSIILTFDSVKTIAEVVDHWNGLNPANLVTHDAADDTVVEETASVQLELGYNEYKKVEVLGEPLLGKLFVIMPNEDTTLLKVGAQQAIDVIVDIGSHPTGDRLIQEINNAIDVKE